nr:MAG TPA: hypothetical protein [Caudoviricetes sp.]
MQFFNLINQDEVNTPSFFIPARRSFKRKICRRPTFKQATRQRETPLKTAVVIGVTVWQSKKFSVRSTKTE